MGIEAAANALTDADALLEIIRYRGRELLADRGPPPGWTEENYLATLNGLCDGRLIVVRRKGTHALTVQDTTTLFELFWPEQDGKNAD